MGSKGACRAVDSSHLVSHANVRHLPFMAPVTHVGGRRTEFCEQVTSMSSPQQFRAALPQVHDVNIQVVILGSIYIYTLVYVHTLVYMRIHMLVGSRISQCLFHLFLGIRFRC